MLIMTSVTPLNNGLYLKLVVFIELKNKKHYPFKNGKKKNKLIESGVFFWN